MEDFSYINPFIANFAKYFFIAGIPFVLYHMLFNHKYAVNKIQSRLVKHKDYIREILHSLQTNVIISVLIILFIGTPLISYTKVYLDIHQYPIWWIPLSVVLSLVIHDTYFYWMHRTLHHPRLYRKAHLVHHQSINPTPWASFSFSFIEGVTESAIFPLLIFILPMHPIALIAFALISTFVNVYGHLGYEIAPKWLRHSFLFELLNTSVHHNLHHEKFKANYGYYFRIWDRLMGTEHPDYVKEYDIVQARRFGRLPP